jgi:hypothetical protein
MQSITQGIILNEAAETYKEYTSVYKDISYPTTGPTVWNIYTHYI